MKLPKASYVLAPMLDLLIGLIAYTLILPRATHISVIAPLLAPTAMS